MPRVEPDRELERLRAMSGAVLAAAPDPILQGCARLASAATGAPIAFVTLALSHQLVLRARHGVPSHWPVCDTLQADLSFCQFVVARGASFQLDDARGRLDIPQAFVRHHGVKAYLGVPVTVRGRVVGTLCVLDTRARPFTAAQRADVRGLAAEAGVRLESLSGTRVALAPEVVAEALAATMAEVRNALTPVTYATSELARLLRELQGSRGDDDDGRAAADVAAGTVGFLTEICGDLEHGLEGLSRAISTLKLVQTAPGTPSCDVGDAVSSGLVLAHHFTKLVAGARLRRLEPNLVAAFSLATTALMVSVATAAFARAVASTGGDGPIAVFVARHGPSIAIRFTAPRTSERAQLHAAQEVARFISGDVQVHVNSGLVLALPSAAS